MKQLAVLMCCLCFLIAIVTASGQELRLLTHVFNESRYDKRILPNMKQSGPVDVIVGLTIYRIEDLTWNDPHLGWEKSEFGEIENITIDNGQIWIPDIVLYNSANEDYSSRRLGRMRPIIHHTGNVTLDCPVVLYTLCRIDVADYPMDRQKCNLVFGSWSHRSTEVRVTSQPNKFDLSRYIDNGQWKIIGTTFEQHLQLYDNRSKGFYDVTFEIFLCRRVLYYAMYLIIPGTLIALLSAIIFLLPQDCSERITVGMAILVALSFFYLLVSETMPASGKVSVVGEFYAATMIEMTISFFLNVLILRFHHMTEEKVPRWVKKYILNYGARFLRMTFRIDYQQLKIRPSHKIMKKKQILMTRKQDFYRVVDEEVDRKLYDEMIADDKAIADVIETEIELAERDAEWKKAAEVLNIYSLLIHILVVIFTFCFVFIDSSPR
ncbi:neuronal acetylcholine receptor subunit alpha-9-like isoform X2 [Dendronephthya gigantea]|uniref:neuronal acetylcholine receptor subunit alpha-9-like isoform X2 n=1 Tax=Dendronephthya gigantea TaxID=151771 RepID=UPI00106BA271|nr:neuronal acetylcholine receptor subunit alpha-9-like isoform X2 [Dendronephthya gigantea]